MKLKYKQIAYIFVTLILVCIIFGVTVFSYFTLQNIQNQSKVTLSGAVSNLAGKPVKGATVMTEGKLVQTDATGSYVIKDLKWGWSQLKIESDNYLPFSQDIYLPFGKPTFQKVVLESVNYAVLKGSVYTDDKKLFEQNKQQIIFKINSTPVSLNQDNSFESDKIPVQKISILIQVPEFDDYYKTISLAGGANNIGSIMLNKKVSSPKIQIKNINTEEIVSRQDVLLNEVPLKTDEEGFLQLANTQLKNGDILNLKIKGFKEKNVIYNASPEALVIFVEENTSKLIPTTYRN